MLNSFVKLITGELKTCFEHSFLLIIREKKLNNMLILLLSLTQDQSWSQWVLCRVYEKMRSEGVNCYSDDDDSGSELSWLDEVYLSLDDDLEKFGMPN